jgi:hypothetical protein
VPFENKTFSSTLKNILAFLTAGVVIVNTGANTTTLSYNTSAVKTYNATNSIAHF